MLGLTAATVMQVAILATTGSEYQEAYDRADEEGKPLLVLVGTTWCPGCRVMKSQTIPELRRSGGLKEIVFTEVDSDAKPKLSRQLLRGNSIPQLVLYTRVGKKWRRTHLTGAQSPAQIRKYLKREIATGRAVAEKSVQAGLASTNVSHKTAAPQQ